MFTIALLSALGLVAISFTYSKSPLYFQRRKRPSTTEQVRLEAELKQFSHFYQQLTPEEQSLFVQRAWNFFCIKEFIARDFNEVTFRMRSIIAAYAAQITFGLKDVELEHFTRIIIYPKAYKSVVTNLWHKGEASLSGTLVFSWEDLTEGHNDPRNGVNLALHELAHAVHLENGIENGEYRFLNERALTAFFEQAEIDIQRIKAGTSTFLRAYATENKFEFFAVCVENFFERPEAFSIHHPYLYRSLSVMLNLDVLKSPVRINE